MILPAAEKMIQQVSHPCPAAAPERSDVESVDSTLTVTATIEAAADVGVDVDAG